MEAPVALASVTSDSVIAPTSQEAQELARPIIERGYRGIDPDNLAIGSVEEVAERFSRWRELGFTDISVRQMSVPQPAALTSLELLGAVREQIA